MEKTKVGIVIPVHNLSWLTNNCLESLFLCTNLALIHVYLVDNGSEKKELKSMEAVLKHFPHFTHIKFTENKGFVIATNTGMRQAIEDGCSHVLLLNNDTVVTVNWLRLMLQSITVGPKAGIVGPMTSPPDWKESSQAKLLIGKKAPYSEFRETMDGYAIQLQKHLGGFSKQRNFVPFCCALITRELIETIGYLSEDYSIGLFDDNDYCTRALQAGFTLWLSQSAYVHHFWNSTFEADKIDYYKLLEENRKVFINKFGFDPWEKDRL